MLGKTEMAEVVLSASDGSRSDGPSTWLARSGQFSHFAIRTPENWQMLKYTLRDVGSLRIYIVDSF